MSDALRVFVNERAVDVPRGAPVREAVAARDAALARLVDSGDAYVTDARGIRVDAGDVVREPGAVFRVVVTARRDAGRLTRETLARWPKVELHVHLDGCLRPATMLELGRAAGVRLPADAPDALAAAMTVRGATNLEEYLEKYALTLALMQTPAALERIAYEFVLDAAADGVRYVEVRYSPLLHRPALSLAQAIEAPLAGLERAGRETGTQARLILCAIRTMPPAASLELARAAADYRGTAVVGFDLAGAEAHHPARDHRAAFEYAAAHGLACTCHAGEGDGPASIADAFHVCGARRIGHGTRLGEDPALLAELVASGTPLEMCVTSNVHTHTVASAAVHPARRYLAAGLRVTLNTDSRLMDGITLTDEYYLAHTALGFTRDELERALFNACDAAFLAEPERVALGARIRSELEAL